MYYHSCLTDKEADSREVARGNTGESVTRLETKLRRFCFIEPPPNGYLSPLTVYYFNFLILLSGCQFSGDISLFW